QGGTAGEQIRLKTQVLGTLSSKEGFENCF
ncbi:MAG: hypothetical protein ACI8UR_001907, partial [Natronomonas sp.]